MNCREQASFARGVYPTRMETETVKQEESNNKLIGTLVVNLKERNVGSKRKSLKRGITTTLHTILYKIAQ